MQSKAFHIFTVKDENEVKLICEHISGVDGVDNVYGDHSTKIFAVQWSAPATWEDIEDTLTRQGYQPAHQ
ncbi:MAG: hypothetical protein CL610_00405 [Anaerolineaceae bacterium]|nr:hypothetical protein [Anaerolineaceae bacterium]